MLLVVGRIGRAHGLRGEVTIEVRTDNPEERFAVGNILVTDPSERGPLEIESLRNHNGTYLLSFKGRQDRNQAESLRNTILLADIDIDQRESSDDFHISEIVGLTVKNESGLTIGSVTNVLELPSQDTLVIKTTQGQEFLLPFVRKHVPTVDLEKEEIIIDNYEGLI